MEKRDPKKIELVGEFLKENDISFAEVVDAMILLNAMNPEDIAKFAQQSSSYIAMRATQIVKCMSAVTKSDLFKAQKLQMKMRNDKK